VDAGLDSKACAAVERGFKQKMVVADKNKMMADERPKPIRR
jgi:hypothetical protein